MKLLKIQFLTISLCVVFSVSSFAQDGAPLQSWTSWRGPLDTGEAPDADPPVSWSEDENVHWKIALPGLGHSTPIVWKDRIFLTSAAPIGEPMEPRYSGRPGAHDNLPVTHKHAFLVTCVNRTDGKILWERTVAERVPKEGGHNTASLASNSPVTDGKHVYAYFGAHGLYCLDVDGEIKWNRDFGEAHSKHGHGEGCSPVLHGDHLVINFDHEGDSFITALDKTTGKEIWRQPRAEVTSWSTPIVVMHDEKPQLIVPGTDRVRGYDLLTGKPIWECGGLSNNIVASPVAGDGMVYIGSSYEKQVLLAIRLKDAQGDITGTKNVVWSRIRATPYVPSPLLYDGSLYFLRHYQGVFARVDAKTGEEKTGPFRLGGLSNIYASPIAAKKRVYITDLDGAAMVITSDDDPKVLSTNVLNDSFSASPVAVNRELLLRGRKYLYCIAED